MTANIYMMGYYISLLILILIQLQKLLFIPSRLARVSHQNKKLECDLGLRTTIDLWPTLLKLFFSEFSENQKKRNLK